MNGFRFMGHLLIPSFINWCLWQLLFAWTFVSYKTTNLAMFLVWLVLLLLNLTGSAVLLAWVQNNGHIYFQNQYWERFVTMITNLYSTIAIYKFVPKNAKKKDIWVRQKPQTPTRPSTITTRFHGIKTSFNFSYCTLELKMRQLFQINLELVL